MLRPRVDHRSPAPTRSRPFGWQPGAGNTPWVPRERKRCRPGGVVCTVPIRWAVPASMGDGAAVEPALDGRRSKPTRWPAFVPMWSWPALRLHRGDPAEAGERGGAGRSPAMRDRKTPRAVRCCPRSPGTAPRLPPGRSYGMGRRPVPAPRRRGGFLQRLLDKPPAAPRHAAGSRPPGARHRNQAAPPSSVTSTSDTPSGLAGVDQPAPWPSASRSAARRCARNLSEISARGERGSRRARRSGPQQSQRRRFRQDAEGWRRRRLPGGTASQPVTGMVNVTPPGSTAVSPSPEQVANRGAKDPPSSTLRRQVEPGQGHELPGVSVDSPRTGSSQIGVWGGWTGLPGLHCAAPGGQRPRPCGPQACGGGAGE